MSLQRRLWAALLCLAPALVSAQVAPAAPEPPPLMSRPEEARPKGAPPTARGIDLQFGRGTSKLTAASAPEWERFLRAASDIAVPITLTIETYGGEVRKSRDAMLLARRRAEVLRNDAILRGVPPGNIVLSPHDTKGPANCAAGAPCMDPGFAEVEMRVRPGS